MKKLSLVLLLILIVVGPIIVPNSEVKAATGGYGTVNLAKGKPVSPLTATVRGKPEDVNDGNIDSVWYSSGSNYGGNSNANSFVLDLGSVYSIGKIDIFPAQIHGFTINTSNDNSTWTERYKSPWLSTSVNAPISVTPDGAFSARYIKYWGYANWSQYVGVLEINVYEWLASPPPSPSGANGSTNLALNKTVTNLLGPVVQSNPPAYAVDGNPATSWASSQSGRDDGTGKWANYGQIKIDLGAKYTIGKVVVSPQRVHDFRMVMAELDPAPAGSPWFFVSYPELFGTAKTSGDPYTFSINGSVTARYIWLTTDIWGTPSNLQPAIAEIEVYEWGSGASPIPATTSTPSSATAPTPVPSARTAEFTLQAEERTVPPNSKTTVPIRLEKADRLGSLNFSLRYDPAVVKVNKAEAGDLAGGTLFQANIRDAGIIRFGIVAQGIAGITGDGPVAHVEFVALGARGAQAQLTLGDLLATDTSGAKLGVTLRAGRVTIAAKLKGDYDGDGKITAKDSLAALKMSVGEIPEDLNLDMDGDGKVTAEDARRILAGALGNPVTVASQPVQPTQPTTSTPPPVAQTPAAATVLVSQDITPSDKEQTVSWKDQVKVTIPAGLVDSKQTLTVATAPGLPPQPVAGIKYLAAFDISLGNLHEFKKELTIEIAYDPSKLTSNSSPETTLAAARWDVNQKIWQTVPVKVDTRRNVAILQTDHLTQFVLFNVINIRVTSAPPPPSIWAVRGALIRMGETGLAERLVRDYNAGYVNISPLDGSARAATGPNLLGGYLGSNTMELNQTEIELSFNNRSAKDKSDPSISWALTVIHEYEHMDQWYPKNKPQWEDPAWSKAMDTAIRWYKKLYGEFESSKKEPPSPGKLEKLEELEVLLTNVAGQLVETYQNLQGPEGTIEQGVVTKGTLWPGLHGPSRDVNELKRDISEQLKKDLKKIADEINAVGGFWGLTGQVVDRIPKTDGSADVPGRDITVDRSVSIVKGAADVVLDWRSKGVTAASAYKAQWTCTWMGPPPPTPATGQWSGPGVASKQPGNFAEINIDIPADKGTPAYKSRWLCNITAGRPPVSGWEDGETWDTTITVQNPRTGTNRNVAVEPRKSVDKSRWACRWPEPPARLKPGQKWEGLVNVRDIGSDNPTAAWVGGRVSLKLGSGPSLGLDVQLPGKTAVSQDFSWDVPGGGKEMAIVATCSATMQPSESGLSRDTIGDTSVTVTYKYELR